MFNLRNSSKRAGLRVDLNPNESPFIPSRPVRGRKLSCFLRKSKPFLSRCKISRLGGSGKSQHPVVAAVVARRLQERPSGTCEDRADPFALAESALHPDNAVAVQKEIGSAND